MSRAAFNRQRRLKNAREAALNQKALTRRRRTRGRLSAANDSKTRNTVREQKNNDEKELADAFEELKLRRPERVCYRCRQKKPQDQVTQCPHCLQVYYCHRRCEHPGPATCDVHLVQCAIMQTLRASIGQGFNLKMPNLPKHALMELVNYGTSYLSSQDRGCVALRIFPYRQKNKVQKTMRGTWKSAHIFPDPISRKVYHMCVFPAQCLKTFAHIHKAYFRFCNTPNTYDVWIPIIYLRFSERTEDVEAISYFAVRKDLASF